MPATKQSVSIESILDGHTPHVRALVDRLRRLVTEAVPTAVEKAYPGWHAIGYRHPDVGYFCGIFPRADDVIFLFEWGILLPDPDGILEGDGKQVRFVTLQDEEAIQTEALQMLIQAALDLPASKEARVRMQTEVAHRKKV